eukprot:gene14330-20318_t
MVDRQTPWFPCLNNIYLHMVKLGYSDNSTTARGAGGPCPQGCQHGTLSVPAGTTLGAETEIRKTGFLHRN